MREDEIWQYGLGNVAIWQRLYAGGGRWRVRTRKIFGMNQNLLQSMGRWKQYNNWEMVKINKCW